MRPFHVRVLLLALFLADASLPGLPLAQEPANKKQAPKGKVKSRPLNPFDRPEGSIVDQTARYYVWYDTKGWHLRTTAKGARGFQGTIKVKDAKIKSCLSVGLQEGKQKGRPDAWKVNGSRSELTFKFVTGQLSDGFDLVVDGEDGQIEFDLSIDDQKNPKAIFVGRGLQHPANNPFTLPAFPKKGK